MKVVMYHYVHPKKDNWLKGLKGLDVKDFASQLDFFKKKCTILDPNSFLDEIVNGQLRIPANSVLLTFDDGYKDCIEYILPELQKRNICGMFFVPNYYRSRQLLDVNFIHLLLTVLTP